MARPMPREPPVTRADLPVRSIMRGPPGGAGRARRARRRRAARRPAPAGACSSASASGIGSTESQSTGRRTPTSSGSTRHRRRSAGGSAVHSMATAPEVKPAPKATMTIWSPTLTRPSLTASASAIGTDAADVLPYLSRLTNILSIGRSRPLATDSMMRMLAWCGMNRSMSDGLQAGPLDRRQRRRGERPGREPVGLLALHPDVVLAAGEGLGRRRALRAARRQPDHVRALRLGRHLQARGRHPVHPTPTATTAPAPSPNRMQVFRSV